MRRFSIVCAIVPCALLILAGCSSDTHTTHAQPAPQTAAIAQSGGIVSTMAVVPATPESKGYFLSSAPDQSGQRYNGDLAVSQVFEIIRPNNEAINLGRLYTSCSCVNLVSPKRSFAQGEKAFVELRNVRATPLNGNTYTFYVQITSPISETLRYDTFVKSVGVETASAPAVKQEAVTESASVTEEKTATEDAADTVSEAPAAEETTAQDKVSTDEVETSSVRDSESTDA